jgi:Surfeit locus protein 6
MDENAENARKRKRNEDKNDDDNQSQSSDGELGSELPKEGLKRVDIKSKKQKQADEEQNKAARNAEAEERRKQKAEKRAEKKAAQRERKRAKQPTAEQEQASADTDKDIQNQDKPDDAVKKDSPEAEGNDMDAVEGFAEISPTSSTNADFSMSNANSGSSSISSIIPPNDTTTTTTTTTKPALKPLKTTPDELRARLQKRLDELRAARHADGLNGRPARTRQELIEARRIKADERKHHKKELRRKAKEEEEQKRDDEMQRRFSPGGSGAGSLLASPRSPAESLASTSNNNNNNFAFGRIAFPDGQHADPTLSRLLDDKTRSGPRDAAAALKAAEAKKERFSALDADKRAELEEKDMWLNAKKRAHGERVRDDTSLLKKALKRKDSAKKKSEREWRERIDGVAKGKEIRQQRRDENIRKRKEGGGSSKSGGGGGGGGGGKGGKKGGKRPGFEGSFKAKSGAANGKKK